MHPNDVTCGLDAINDIRCDGEAAGLPQSTPQCNKVNSRKSRERTESLLDTSSLDFSCRTRFFFPACVACSHRCQVKERHKA